ncbi:hypothetical protein R3I93_021393 [Phoxinus phoxinus]|uniref:HAT C-terminal dimerisation domain-containing protein n=1 Tax=Phoxinus phoxinus TaxID=58324 RepID=A0AAN9CAA3_9TELE
MLQAKNADLLKATELLDNAITELTRFRESFEEAKTTAQSMAEKWGVKQTFEKERIRRAKRQFDEFCQDERLADAESYFKVNVFNACLDIIIAQLSRRFSALRSVADLFRVVQPHILATEEKNAIYQGALRLVEKYNNDLSPALPQQLIAFRAAFKRQISEMTTVQDLASFLIVENNSITSSFSDICTVLVLFLTIPVTVASAERSFSKLKLIKNYLRSTMSQNRLSGLAILSIENTRSRELNTSDIVDEFAERKARRMQLK